MTNTSSCWLAACAEVAFGSEAEEGERESGLPSGKGESGGREGGREGGRGRGRGRGRDGGREAGDIVWKRGR